MWEVGSPPLDSGISGKAENYPEYPEFIRFSRYSGRDLTGFPVIPDCLNIFPDFLDIPEIKWDDDHGCIRELERDASVFILYEIMGA